MTKVYLNPSKLDEKLSTVDLFRSSVESAYSLIRNHYTQDPIREELSSCLDNFSKAGQGLLLRTDEIRRIKKNIEQLSSTGVATFDSASGQITFEVPDGVDVDTPKNLEMWSQGTLDANDLRSGESKLPSGRSFDEVMESMKANKGDTTYANSFIDRVGPENLTKLGDERFSTNREAPIVGEILGTASQTWDKEKSKKNADLIIGSVDDKSEWRRLPILSKMIGYHDADNDGVSDLKFGTYFLAFMGDAAEKLPHEDIKKAARAYPKDRRYGVYGLEGARRYDPLFCITDAMTNNGEAAAMFFGKNGLEDDGKNIKRVQDITRRYSFGDNQWTNNLAIISDKMSELGLINTKTASPEKIKLSDQAALGTSAIVNAIGQSGVKLSGTSRSHLSNVLKNYAPGVDHSIQSAGMIKDKYASRAMYLSGKFPGHESDDNYKDAYWGGGIPTQPNFSDCTLSNLTGQIGLADEHALDGLKSELGYIADRRMEFAASYNSELPDEGENSKQTSLQTAIDNYRKTQGFIAGAITREGVSQGINSDKQVKAWIDGVSGVTGFLPVPGGGKAGEAVKHLFKAGVSYIEGRGEKGAMDALEDSFANNQEKAEIEGGDKLAYTDRLAKESLAMKLVQSGVIKQDELAKWKNRSDSLFNEDGTLKKEKLDARNDLLNEDVLKAKCDEGEDPERAKADAIRQKSNERVEINGAFDDFEKNMGEVAPPWVVNAYRHGSDTGFMSSVQRAAGVPYGTETTEAAKNASLNKFGED